MAGAVEVRPRVFVSSFMELCLMSGPCCPTVTRTAHLKLQQLRAMCSLVRQLCAAGLFPGFPWLFIRCGRLAGRLDPSCVDRGRYYHVKPRASMGHGLQIPRIDVCEVMPRRTTPGLTISILKARLQALLRRCLEEGYENLKSRGSRWTRRTDKLEPLSGSMDVVAL